MTRPHTAAEPSAVTLHLRNPFTGDYWVATRDGDPRAMALYKRHYSYRKYADGRNPKTFVGPGQKTVLLTTNCDALFVWRKFKSLDNQEGINCAVFRNESPILSSDLIAEAMDAAWRRWPGERLYTYVNPHKITGSNPGLCFKEAGWHFCDWTQGGLLIFDVPGIVARLFGRAA